VPIYTFAQFLAYNYQFDGEYMRKIVSIILMFSTILLSTDADHLLLTAITIKPSDAEMFIVTNPTTSTIDLTDYYITDATSTDKYYYNLPLGQNYWSGIPNDFIARFPTITLAPGDTLTVSLSDSMEFKNYYDYDADLVMNEDFLNASSDGSTTIGPIVGLADDKECLVLFKWDGINPTVMDVDYFVWGDDSYATSKTTADGYPYNDTPIAEQQQIRTYNSSEIIDSVFIRLLHSEETEIHTNGNGITGHDETSENIPIEWDILPISVFNIGCTDELAINYDPEASSDSGNCLYLDDIEQHFQQNWQGIPINPMGIYVNSAILDDINLRIGDEIAIFDDSECVGMIQLTDEITSPIQIFLSQDDPDTPEIDGFEEGGNIIYKYWDASEQFIVINIYPILLNGDDVFTHLGYSEIELSVNSILGCTDYNSINYLPEATVDDGSCVSIIIGCMDPEACNYDPEANEEGSCVYFDCAGECNGEAYLDDCGVCDDVPENDNDCYGCMDQWAMNFSPNATIDDGTCDYPSIGDISMDGAIDILDIVMLVGVVLDGDIYIEYMDFNQDVYLNIIDIVIIVDIILHPNTLGCIDPNASNYNPEALYDDGSCYYPFLIGNIVFSGIAESILGDGISTDTLFVTAYDDYGNAVPNATIRIATDAGLFPDDLQQVDLNTNSSGTVSIILTSQPGLIDYTAHLTATSLDNIILVDNETIIYRGITLTLDPEADTILANGISTCSIVAQLKETTNGNPLVDKTINWATNLGIILQSDVTDITGSASATLLSQDGILGTATISATYGLLNPATTTVEFIDPPPPSNISLSWELGGSDGGISSIMLNVLLTDSNSNPVENFEVDFSIDPSNIGSFSPSTDLTNENGQAQVVFTYPVENSQMNATFTATAGTIIDNLSITLP
jgi:hypothetical protein